MAAASWIIKKHKLPWLPTADLLAPYIILGYAIGRMGCFMVGDVYGIPIEVPWAMAVPKGLPPTTIPVHPTQIYEVIAGLCIYALLQTYRKRDHVPGQVFFLYMMLAGAERFLVEFVRTNQHYVLGMSGAQVIALILISAGAYLWYWIPRRTQATT